MVKLDRYPTWGDLLNYMKECHIEFTDATKPQHPDYRMHYPIPKDDAILRPHWSFFIYDLRYKMTINLPDRFGEHAPVMRVTFDDESVTIDNLSHAYVDYDSTLDLLNTEFISGPEAGDWWTRFIYGKPIQILLNNTLCNKTMKW